MKHPLKIPHEIPHEIPRWITVKNPYFSPVNLGSLTPAAQSLGAFARPGVLSAPNGDGMVMVNGNSPRPYQTKATENADSPVIFMIYAWSMVNMSVSIWLIIANQPDALQNEWNWWWNFLGEYEMGCLIMPRQISGLQEPRSMGDLQDPKMKVLYHISGHILGVYPLT